VGGGLILGGRLHRGIFSSAGEIGHTPVEWDGERCACGLRGCLEAYVGGAAWARRLRTQAPPDWCPAEPRESLSPKHVVAAAREGDAFALAELDRYNRYLARGIVQVTFTVAPQLVVLGTIPTAAGEELCLRPVRARVRERLWPFLADALQIETSRLGPELPALAGLSAALEGIDVTHLP
jgi:predicted NBD/HSP70 family sugar kinase